MRRTLFHPGATVDHHLMSLHAAFVTCREVKRDLGNVAAMS